MMQTLLIRLLRSIHTRFQHDKSLSQRVVCPHVCTISQQDGEQCLVVWSSVYDAFMIDGGNLGLT
jgi:hypothetical protein